MEPMVERITLGFVISTQVFVEKNAAHAGTLTGPKNGSRISRILKIFKDHDQRIFSCQYFFLAPGRQFQNGKDPWGVLVSHI